MQTWDVVVVGSGVCGLTIAHTLTERGRSVLLLDKGSRPGGRLASRPLGGMLLNTSVANVIADDDEVMAEITRRTGAKFTPASGSDRFSEWNFTEPAGDIAARWAAGAVIRHTFVTHFEVETNGLIHVVPHGTGDAIAAEQLVLTAPLPQSAEILRLSGADATPPLAAVTYERRDVLLCVVVGPEESEHFLDESAVIDLIRMRHRDDTGLVWLELFANYEWSALHAHVDANFAHAALLHELRRLYPGARVMNSELKRWRYADSRITVPNATFDAEQSASGVIVAGDGFGLLRDHPNGIERAVRSGLDVAAALA
ncbi:FAD-dependent oxidoreductase [Cryobacterium frigoriphilum]|uniref:FAD-dependent oxidoreductase n=1 Tax=Cryobacterium frigoriphilum TaxID=1259150 RepID=A0A4R9A8U1_9MICO|nr:FAD-dependent oxidoreductase [Cryobacterium frigoriphilum]TFD54046.1 FAD-dependent oxidoreductase [Cryobacterium frigoriphilum]